MTELNVQEFYETKADTKWGPIHKQTDPLTFYTLSTKSEYQAIRVTCAKKEVDWLAKIISEVNSFDIYQSKLMID